MKQCRIILIITVLFVCMTNIALASGFGGLGVLSSDTGTVPDPAAILGSAGVFYGNDIVIDGIVYYGYAYAMPADMDAFASEYISLAVDAGYAASDIVIDSIETSKNVPALLITSGMLNAYIVPDYRGCLLFLMNPNMDSPLLPTPAPTAPAATAAPAQYYEDEEAPSQNSGYSGGHVEYVEVKTDCFACNGGVCSLCGGSGIYRMYGEEVPCSTRCETCDGLGYWYSTQPVWVQ